MKTTSPFIEHDAPPYPEYKAEIFKNTNQRMLNILNGVSQTSLKNKDAMKLIKEIKTLAKNF